MARCREKSCGKILDGMDGRQIFSNNQLCLCKYSSVICTTQTLTSCFVHAGRLEGRNKNGQLFSCSIQRCILDIWNHITEHRNRIILKTLQ